MDFQNLDSKKRQDLLEFIFLSLDKIIKPYENSVQGPLGPRQYYSLKVISDCGPITMSMFADRAKIKKQQTTKIVNRLVELGMVNRIYTKADRRTIKINITDSGRDFLEKNNLRSLDCIVDVVEQLGDAENERFYEVVGTLNELLGRMPKMAIAECSADADEA